MWGVSLVNQEIGQCLFFLSVRVVLLLLLFCCFLFCCFFHKIVFIIVLTKAYPWPYFHFSYFFSV